MYVCRRKLIQRNAFRIPQFSNLLDLRSITVVLSINNPKTDKLVTELVKLTGESKTQVVIQALEEGLAFLRKGTAKNTLPERLLEIALELDELPEFDDRSPDEILGYDENGLPT